MTILLFDIDNTLLNFDRAEEVALGKIFEHYNIEDNDVNRSIYSRENKALWRSHEAGEISRAELLSTRFVKAFEAMKITTPYDGHQVDVDYQYYLSQGHEMMEHAQELLDELSKTPARLYIVSNGTSKVSRPRIIESGITPYFDEIFISEEVGAHKPSLAFFDYVLNHIKTDENEEITIIGDSLTTDIQGGNNAGIHTIWYNPKHLSVSTDSIPEYEISDLLDVLSVVNL
ncbi:YjjG family noncanonical pyrimidine nucleotidase [Lactococcus fujiensis]|uniref:Hydrolase n=1 Tax=Lactococcus fujiensis JCM 16395 TaxID=1291764 RepID=A0A2A5RQA2_9LACT|nr:YjjG family noncanonical pyrimidine nucleotidase [Lactococcus fujiensis]PCS01623.1 hydrolase [Lactococcus fujiensis JCM 16395]